MDEQHEQQSTQTAAAPQAAPAESEPVRYRGIIHSEPDRWGDLHLTVAVVGQETNLPGRREKVLRGEDRIFVTEAIQLWEIAPEHAPAKLTQPRFIFRPGS